ncbi:Protease PrsW [Actinobacteria bacterium OK074]|nr:Protease PrsW [Actinobacteria bacterium OK074]
MTPTPEAIPPTSLVPSMPTRPPGAPSSGPSPSPRVPRHGIASAIAVAGVLSVAYAIGQILYWAAPDIVSPSPWVKVWLLPEPTPFRVTRYLLVAGWCVAAALALVLLLTRRHATTADADAVRSELPFLLQLATRTCQFGILGALLLPFAAMPLAALGSNFPQLLLCLPTTAAALFLVHRAQLYRRMPGWLLLSGFGWGVLIGGGFGLVMITWFQRYGAGYFLDFRRPRGSIREIYTLFCLNGAVVTELGKAAGVAVLFLLFRRHIDGVVSGVVLGAAVGLGFNLTETVHYLGFIQSAHHPAQFWDRQVVGLFAAHVAFTALVGAGFGAARWLPERRDRWVAVGGGLLAAVGGHFETDVVLMRLDQHRGEWFGHHETLSLLLGIPLMTLITSGVFVVLYVLILRRGLRAQAAGLARALHAESGLSGGPARAAVTAPEIPLLLSPRRRLLLELRVWRRDGTAGLRHLVRFQQAQLDLATQHWHRERDGADIFVPDDHQLRARVLELKGLGTAAATPSGQAPPAQEALS